MEISEADHAAINAALTDEVDPLYRSNTKYSKDVIEKTRYICNDALERPEFWANGFDMDGGLNAAEIYVREKYPWLTQPAIYAVRHYCMMAMK